MRVRPSLLLSLVVMGLSAWAVLTAMAWPWKAALFPLAIGIPVFCLAGAESLLTLFGSRVEGQAMDFQLSEHVPQEVAIRRTLAISFWILAFFFMILLLGFPIAIPLFVLLYLKIQAREGWTLSLLLTAAAWGFFSVLFQRLLNIPFPEGLIQTWTGIH